MAGIITVSTRAIQFALNESESKVVAEVARLDNDQLRDLARAAALLHGVASAELSNRGD
jgi:hypothetical protein